MQIIIRSKFYYGKVCFYPVCADARTFALIANTKTLTEATLKSIGRLGYTIQHEETEAKPAFTLYNFATFLNPRTEEIEETVKK